MRLHESWNYQKIKIRPFDLNERIISIPLINRIMKNFVETRLGKFELDKIQLIREFLWYSTKMFLSSTVAGGSFDYVTKTVIEKCFSYLRWEWAVVDPEFCRWNRSVWYVRSRTLRPNSGRKNFSFRKWKLLSFSSMDFYFFVIFLVFDFVHFRLVKFDGAENFRDFFFKILKEKIRREFPSFFEFSWKEKTFFAATNSERISLLLASRVEVSSSPETCSSPEFDRSFSIVSSVFRSFSLLFLRDVRNSSYRDWRKRKAPTGRNLSPRLSQIGPKMTPSRSVFIEFSSESKTEDKKEHFSFKNVSNKDLLTLILNQFVFSMSNRNFIRVSTVEKLFNQWRFSFRDRLNFSLRWKVNVWT